MAKEVDDKKDASFQERDDGERSVAVGFLDGRG